MTAEEAAAFLGVEVKNLATLLARYGIGRYYVAQHGEQFFYATADLERVKRNIEATAEAPSA